MQQAAWAFGDGDYANVAVVQGAGEGENRATVTVGLTDATGADRRELYVDARDVQPDEEKGETNKSEATSSGSWPGAPTNCWNSCAPAPLS